MTENPWVVHLVVLLETMKRVNMSRQHNVSMPRTVARHLRH